MTWCEAHCDGPFGSSLRQLIATHWVAQDAQEAEALANPEVLAEYAAPA